MVNGGPIEIKKTYAKSKFKKRRLRNPVQETAGSGNEGKSEGQWGWILGCGESFL